MSPFLQLSYTGVNLRYYQKHVNMSNIVTLFCYCRLVVVAYWSERRQRIDKKHQNALFNHSFHNVNLYLDKESAARNATVILFAHLQSFYIVLRNIARKVLRTYVEFS